MLKTIQHKSFEIENVEKILQEINEKIEDKAGENWTPKTIYIKKLDSPKFICICETLVPIDIVDNRIAEQEKALASANKTDIIGFTPVFGVLTTNQIKKISPLLLKKKFEPETVIFNEGDKADELYIISSGKVIIYKYVDEEKNKIEILATLCKGDIFGDMAVIDDAPRSAYGKAVIEPCELYSMNKTAFFDLLKTYPEISINLNKIYCKRLREMNKKLVESLNTGEKDSSELQEEEEIRRETIRPRVLRRPEAKTEEERKTKSLTPGSIMERRRQMAKSGNE